MKLCLIGNLNHFTPKTCGQVTKTLLYYSILRKEYKDLDYIDLSSKFHILYFFIFAKRITKKYDLIVALPGPRSCHYILPKLVKSNKKRHCRIIYSAIGVGYFKNNFINALNNDKTFVRNIKKNDVFTFKHIDACLFELENVSDLHKTFYLCSNSFVIPNFRNVKICKNRHVFSKQNSPLKIVFLSRICEIKGIFDLIKVVKDINNDGYKVQLDIFGENNSLNFDELKLFNENLNNYISYKGHVDNNKVIDLFSNYDVLCFPTKYFVEGIPGVIVEAFMSGTPIISSNFLQAKYLFNNGINGLIYKFNNKKDLKNKILDMYNNRKILKKLSIAAYKTGKKYTYSYWRKNFLNIINGKDVK